MDNVISIQEVMFSTKKEEPKIIFTKCANMTEEHFGEASRNSVNNYDKIVHLGTRNGFDVFAAYRASENYQHPVIFKGHLKK